MKNIKCISKRYSTTQLLVDDKQKVHDVQCNKIQIHKRLPVNKTRIFEGGLRFKNFHKQSFNHKPLITIITVVLNQEQYIEECINSVLNQTYENIEYIIIDGGSSDKTTSIISRYEDKIDYWVSEKDNGIYAAWNKAIKLSCGEWIGFIGADDFYEHYAIEEYVKHINLNKDIEYISSQSNLYSKEKTNHIAFGSAWNWKDFSTYMNVAHVGSLHNISLFKKYGIYDETFKICGDYELLLRARETLKAMFVNKILCNMRPGGISSINPNVFDETLDAKLKNRSRPTRVHAYFDMLIGMMKHIIKKML